MNNISGMFMSLADRLLIGHSGHPTSNERVVGIRRSTDLRTLLGIEGLLPIQTNEPSVWVFG